MIAALALAAALAATSPAGLPPPEPSREVYGLDLAADVAAVAASAVVATIPNLFASDIIHPRCPCPSSEVNRLDRFAIGLSSDVADVASTATVAAAVLVPPALDLAHLGPGRAFVEDAVVFTESLVVNAALVEIAKYAVQRPLPRTYAGDPSLLRQPGGYRSFYSGHTSTAFAALMTAAYTVRLRHGERIWPWIAAVAVGGSVGVERVLAGRHFPTDVAVGAAAGTAVGLAVPWLHARRGGPTIAPGPGAGLSLRGRF